MGRPPGTEPSGGARLTPENVFLVVGAVIGLCLAIGIPAYEGADEVAHFARAYQVSEGGLVAERRGDRVGGMLPVAIKARRGPLDAEQRSFADFRNTAIYPPLPYLPQALVLVPGRLLRLPPRALLHLARVAGLAAALGLGYLAIRTTPIAKRAFLLLALSPVAVRQMSTVTADIVTNGAALLFLGMVLRRAGAAAEPAPATRLVGLVLCSVAMTLAKPAYLPLVLLYLVGPAGPRGGRRRVVPGFAALVLVTAAALAVWWWAARGLYAPQRIAPDADPGRQLALVVAEPLRFAGLLAADLRHDGATYLHGVVFPGETWRWLSSLYLAVVAAVALLDGHRGWTLGAGSRVLIAVAAAAAYVSVNALSYLAFNPVGAATVSFVQPRYFVPIAPAALLLLTNRRLAALVRERHLTLIAAICATCSALLGLLIYLTR